MASISIQTKKFADLAEIQIAKPGDMTFIHDGKGVKKIAAENLAHVTNPDVGAHNSVYRGKYLGNTVSIAQYQEIKEGRFNDMYIGDYWTMDGVNYRIAAFDYYLNTGDPLCTVHHITLVPDSSLGQSKMNLTNTTEGGYYNSEMRTFMNNGISSMLYTHFPDHILSHYILLTNAAIGGMASGSMWTYSEVDLMTEGMLYGTRIFSKNADTSSNFGVFCGQLPLFKHRPDLINRKIDYWLRDIVSATSFALVSRAGRPNVYPAGASFEVRPSFSITGG